LGLRVCFELCEFGFKTEISIPASSHPSENPRSISSSRFLAFTSGVKAFLYRKASFGIVNLIRPQKMIQDIRQIKSKIDLIIVYLHFGNEYSHTPYQCQIHGRSDLSSHTTHLKWCMWYGKIRGNSVIILNEYNSAAMEPISLVFLLTHSAQLKGRIASTIVIV
jgi:hypothetical protein